MDNPDNITLENNQSGGSLTDKLIRIQDNFIVVNQIADEPLGKYYKVESYAGNEFLLLLLSEECSKLARKQWGALYQQIFGGVGSEETDNQNKVFIPVLDIIDFVEGVALVMPYTNGMTLSQYIHKTKKLSIKKTKVLLKDSLESLSSLHKENNYHGFINFSTCWVVDNKLYILGADVFHHISHKANYELSKLGNLIISSCIDKEITDYKIECSIYADYYSLLILFCSLISGEIISKDKLRAKSFIAKIGDNKDYLNPISCQKAFEDKMSVADWLGKVKIITYKLPKYTVHTILTVFTIASGGYLLWPTLVDVSKQAVVNSRMTVYNVAINAMNLQKQIHTSYQNSKKRARLNKYKSYASVSGDSGLTAQDLVLSSFDDDLVDYIEPRIVATSASSLPVSTEKTNNNLNCSDNNCYDLVAAGIKGPSLTHTEILDDTVLVMTQPISRKDYYVFCYLDKSCTAPQFDEQTLEQCLFENNCDQNLTAWLTKPMEFVSSYQVTNYINWLNNATASKYDIISDSYWSTLATKINVKNNCINSNGFIVNTIYPEWVKIDQAIALREAVKLDSNQQQCHTALKFEDPKKYLGNVLVRLVKYS